MFHYKKGMVYKTTADSTSLYADEANTLLTHVFCNLVHHSDLPKFQNRHPYRIAADTDIAAHVATTYPALPGLHIHTGIFQGKIKNFAGFKNPLVCSSELTVL